LVAGVAAGVYAGLQWLGRTFGATRAECRRLLPGDELCTRPHVVTNHAITIHVPPAEVWPWLVQMGWGRGQWYTARWVDAMLFPDNRPSADRVVAEWQHLDVGDLVLDGPPEKECAFVVRAIEAPRHLVLHSRQHLPPAWAERFGASIDWSWAFVLDEVDVDRTRLLIRSRLRVEPRWVRACYVGAGVPADFVMSRQMLLGVKARAERRTGAALGARSRAVAG
jgi:hypothetical protein